MLRRGECGKVGTMGLGLWGVRSLNASVDVKIGTRTKGRNNGIVNREFSLPVWGCENLI